jgi:hypothetical protein
MNIVNNIVIYMTHIYIAAIVNIIVIYMTYIYTYMTYTHTHTHTHTHGTIFENWRQGEKSN